MELLLGKQRTTSPAVAQNDEVMTAHGLVRKGMKLVCRDGTAGRVAMILPNPRLPGVTQLVVRQGWWNPRLFLVPPAWIVAVVDEELRLNVYRRQLELLPEYRTDAQIAADVREALATSAVFAPHADFAAIRVAVDHGAVVLYGNVRNGARKYAARQLVESVRGVRAIRSLLIDDDELKLHVKTALKRANRLEEAALQVEVALGLVMLRGNVCSAAQREQVRTIVQEIGGVRRIADELTIC